MTPPADCETKEVRARLVNLIQNAYSFAANGRRLSSELFARVARLPIPSLQTLGSALADPKPSGRKNHDPLALILAAVVASEEACGRVAMGRWDERSRTDPETQPFGA
jgi:hypothetical protein